MKILLLHSDDFEYEVKKKAIKAAEEVSKEPVHVKDALVAMMAVEKTDEGNFESVANRTVDEIIKVAEELKATNIVCYPWVHLTSKPARPDVALKVMREVEARLNSMKQFKLVVRAPFGWYKGFTIKVKGHPLSELSREFTIETTAEDDNEIVSAALIAEDETKHDFFVVSKDGDLIPFNEFKFEPKSNFKKFFEYETQKRRAAEEPPTHVELMQRLELVDYEEASDAGNMRWYPNGWVVKRLLEDHVTNTMIDHGAYAVETPIMYDFNHPALASYMNRFPARQYVLSSGSDRFFLRFAACFGQFLIASDATISYRQLPLKLFEMTHYSFRREQRGELAALRRLRTFSMPDQHTIVADMDMAKEEFKKQYELCVQMMADFELDYEAVFRFQRDFFEENKEWILSMIKLLDRPVMLELFDKRYAYFVCKFEFNVIDGQGKAAALSTVQIDVENAQRFNIKYIGDDGQKHDPYILHASVSGAIERVLYGILEQAAMKAKRGQKPSFPLWLAPVQVRLCPVTESQLDYCIKLAEEMTKAGIRADVDDRGERVGKMIREAERVWIPLIFIIGNEEVKTGILKPRTRDGSKLTFKRDTVVQELKERIGDYPTRKLPMSIFLSKRPIFFSAN